jgi:TldD protein
MKRRNFIKCCSVAVPGAFIFNSIGSSVLSANTPRHKSYDDDFIKKMADTAIFTSKQNGASYSDFRLSNFRSQSVFTREQAIQSINDNENFGFSVRVIIDDTWGFAASSTFS